MNINQMAVRYQKDLTNESFRELYEAVTEKLRSKLEYDIRVNKFDPHDITAAYDDAILEAAMTYDESLGDFLARVYTKIVDKKKRLIRKSAKLTEQPLDESIEVYEDFNRETTPTPEEIVIQKLQKEKSQRQLTPFLVAAANDDFTRQVIKLFPSFEYPSQLAKVLRVHHSKVTRSLERLARRYDANRFGDIRDYLAV